jgi:hypothetical protein
MRVLHSFAVAVVLLSSTGCDGAKSNRYAGTAEQAGAMYLTLCARSIAIAVRNYRSDQGKWPSSLTDLVRENLLQKSDILYPKLYDLPDRRDIPQAAYVLEWIYLKPKSDSNEMLLVVAPIPFTGSMGKPLERPKRIIARYGGIAERVEEPEVARLLNRYSSQ